MEDMASKISELLGDPSTMEQIMNLTSMLGVGSNEETPNISPPTPPPSPPQKEPLVQPPAFSGDMMQTMLKLAPVISNLNQDNDITCLLNALRPFLSEERTKKLDQAAKLLQILKLLPLIKELNIL